jgi:hypothetical protein
MEQTLMSTPAEGEEHSAELLKIFSQEAETGMTAALEPAAEERANSIDFVELYEELEALERRMIAQSQHIQQIRLETDGGAYQPREQLEEVGDVPAKELTETNMSEGETEQQLSEETAELESAAEWQLSATRGNKDSMGNRVDLHNDKYGKEKEVQWRRLHKKSQPLEQLDMVIEEIRRLMLRSAQGAVSKGKLNRGDPATVARKKEKKKQHRQQKQQRHS